MRQSKIPIRLDIGSGTLPRGGDGWTHIDVVPYPHVERVGDAKQIVESYADDSVEEIYTSHFLEHLPPPLIPPTLALWHDKLRPGGALEVHVPNMQELFTRFLEAGTEAAKDIALTQVFGHWTESYPHRWGFDIDMLVNILRAAGFGGFVPCPSRTLPSEDKSEIGMRCQAMKPRR